MFSFFNKRAERKILAALVEQPPLSGARISKVTGLGSARMYPALQRLEMRGEIKAGWESHFNFPRSRVYSTDPTNDHDRESSESNR